MRRFLTFVALTAALGGCKGEEVEAPLDDAGATDAPSEVASEAATDGAPEADAREGGTVNAGCADADNLIPNGNFASGSAGWAFDGLTLEPIVEGPCGFAMRTYATEKYGNYRRRQYVKLPVGTKLRLQVWDRDNGAPKGDHPGVLARLGHAVDGGEVTNEQVTIPLVLGTLWSHSEQTMTVTEEEEWVDLIVTTSRMDGLSDDFVVTGISLTIVK